MLKAPNTKLRLTSKHSLDVNLRTVQRIRKEFDGSHSDFEGMATQKSQSDHSDKKRTPEFVGEIQAMIEHYLSNSIKSIVKVTGVHEFINRQTVHKDIRLGISHTIFRKG